MMGFFHQGHVDGDEVGVLEEMVYVHVFYAVFLLKIRSSNHVVIEHFHVEAFGSHRNGAAYSPEPHNAQSGAVDVSSLQHHRMPAYFPLSRAEILVDDVEAARH